MKTVFIILATLVGFISNAQDNPDEDYKFEDYKIEIGSISNGTIIYKDIPSDFVNKFNKENYHGKSYIQSMTIQKGEAYNDKDKTFYYLTLHSEDDNYNRLLLEENNKLYMISEPNNYLFYYSCKGDENCDLRMNYIDGEYKWSCGDYRACGVDSTCKRAVSIIE